MNIRCVSCISCFITSLHHYIIISLHHCPLFYCMFYCIYCNLFYGISALHPVCCIQLYCTLYSVSAFRHSVPQHSVLSISVFITSCFTEPLLYYISACTLLYHISALPHLRFIASRFIVSLLYDIQSYGIPSYSIPSYSVQSYSISVLLIKTHHR